MKQTDNEIPQHLLKKLNNIKDRCDPPEKFWFKSYYVILLLCCLIPLVSHNLMFAGKDFNEMRMAHGLLPIQAVLVRNTAIPALIPIIVFACFAFSIRIRLFRSAAWLACLSLLCLFLTSAYLWLCALFFAAR